MTKTKTRGFLIAAFVLSSVGAAAAFAQRPINPKPYLPDDVEEPEPWREEQPTPPAFPVDANLLAFSVSGASDNEFFVDRTSISIGKDYVIRYTVVIKSSAGARTITYEGMRCDTRERKIYLTGRNDATWSRARFAKWEDIEYKHINGYIRVLFSDFFCPQRIRIASVDEGISALKAGIHPRAKVRR